MVDPGSAVGIVGFLGQLLSGSIQAYRFIEHTKPKKMSSKCNSVMVAFLVQRDRYITWIQETFGTQDPNDPLFSSFAGTSSSPSPSHSAPRYSTQNTTPGAVDRILLERFDTKRYHMIVMVIKEICKLLKEAQQTERKFGLHPYKSVFESRASRKTISWVLVGEEEFNELVGMLRSFNDDLVSLCAPNDQTRGPLVTHQFRWRYPPKWENFEAVVMDMATAAQDLDACITNARSGDVDLNDVVEDRYNMQILLSQNRLFLKLESNRFQLSGLSEIQRASQWLGIQLRQRPSSVKFPIIITGKGSDQTRPSTVPPLHSDRHHHHHDPHEPPPAYNEHAQGPATAAAATYAHRHSHCCSHLVGQDQIQRHIQILFESIRSDGEAFPSENLDSLALGLKRLNRKHHAEDSNLYILAAQHIRELGYCLGGFYGDVNTSFNHFAYQCSSSSGGSGEGPEAVDPQDIHIITLKDILNHEVTSRGGYGPSVGGRSGGGVKGVRYTLDQIKDKVNLAHIIASSYLHLMGTSWMPRNLDAKDIHYLYPVPQASLQGSYRSLADSMEAIIQGGSGRAYIKPYIEITDPDLNQTDIEPGDISIGFFNLGLLLFRIFDPGNFPDKRVNWLRDEWQWRRSVQPSSLPASSSSGGRSSVAEWLRGYQEWNWKGIRTQFGVEVEKAVFACLVGEFKAQDTVMGGTGGGGKRSDVDIQVRRNFYEMVVARLWGRLSDLADLP